MFYVLFVVVSCMLLLRVLSIYLSISLSFYLLTVSEIVFWENGQTDKNKIWVIAKMNELFVTDW